MFTEKAVFYQKRQTRSPVFLRKVRHRSTCLDNNTPLNTRVGVHPVGTQVAGNRDPFSGSRHVQLQRTVDRAIPSFLILMNPVSLKYGRGASPFIGSRIEGFPGAQSHAIPTPLSAAAATHRNVSIVNYEGPDEGAPTACA